MRSFIVPFSLLVLAGCTMAPDYQQPTTPDVNTWTAAASKENAARKGWREVFPDANLQDVVALALQHNTDLRLALLNVESYQAQYRIQRAALLPSLNVTASDTRSHTPGDINGTGSEVTASNYNAGVGITAYELDVFGRVRSLKDQALQTYLSEVETQRSTQITLVANVADAYLTLVADTELLKLAEQNLRIEQDNANLVQRRYDLGVGSSMELAQSQGSLADIKVRTEQYRRLIKLDRNALELLLGTKLSKDWLPKETLAEVSVARVEPGLPSSLLTQRPDILAAEHQLRAADANIGAARAAFFPSISLTANYGSASTDLDNLFDSGQDSWSFSPSINLPIFSGGRLTAQLDVAKVAQKMAVTRYQSAIQNAFTEVSNALVQRTGYQQQLQDQQQAQASYQKYFDIADMRYQKGIDSMLTRLDAQRNLVASQQATINARLSWLQSQVDLYRALGGGWTDITPSADTTATTNN